LDYPENPKELQFYRKLLSGVLDPDKLDYLNRDAYFCGIPYGIQDIDFVISQMLPHPDQGMGITSKGIMAVENILFSKYLMYKSVYWHKGVRTTSAIVKKALTLGLEEGIISPEDLYWTNDNSFTQVLSKKDYSPLKNIALAQTPWIFRALFEDTFDEQNIFHHRLMDSKRRKNIESDIAQNLSKVSGQAIHSHQIAIDVPRAISMEVGLPIIHEGQSIPFPESDTVFNPLVIQGFTQNLKKIRLIGPAFLEDLPKEVFQGIFHS